MSKSSRFVHTLVEAGRHTARQATGRYLILTNTVACGCLLGAGDVAAQMIEKYGSKKTSKSSSLFSWDKERTGRFFTYGLLMGPVNHAWYGMLDKILPRVTMKTILRKIAIDQAVFAPFAIVAFFIGVGCLEGRSLTHNAQIAKSNFVPVYKMDLCLWPAAQLVNFFLLPPQLRVIYVSFVTFFWNTFLAFYKENWQKKTSDDQNPLCDGTVSTKLKAEGEKYLSLLETENEDQELLARTKKIVGQIRL